MDNLIETFLNLMVFAFIGLLLWLYFKPESTEQKPHKNGSQKDT